MGDVSIITGTVNKLGIADYIIFGAILLISALIGCFFAWKDRNVTNLKDFILAGQSMSVFPVTMSLVASFLSGITLMGIPVEMYQYNTMYFYIGLSYFFVMAGAAHIYQPMFYRLKVISVNEYIEKRFCKALRTAASVVFIFQMTLYMAIVLYAPSLALYSVTGFTLWGSVVSVGVVCALYTALGGMRGVLWADSLQTVIMFIGYIALLAQCSVKIGNFSDAWDKISASGRVVFDDFSFNPNVRHTFWSVVIGGYFTWLAIYGINQSQVQRACCCPTLFRAQVALWMNMVILCIILYMGCLIGVYVYAFYQDCDPIVSGLAKNTDEIITLFVMDIMGDVTGLPGLFFTALFSGALSTISSGLNGIATCFVEDLIRGYCVKDLTDAKAARYTQIVSVGFGFLCVALTYVASMLGNILQSALSLFGLIGGPVLGLFTLGIIFPWANKWGAAAGLICSLIIMFWIGVGTFIESPPTIRAPLPHYATHCEFLNHTTGDPNSTLLNFTMTTGSFDMYNISSVTETMSMLYNTTMTSETMTTAATNMTAEADRSPVYDVYTLSYMWYGMYAVIIVIVVGLIVSFLTGYTRPSSLDPKLICPIFDMLPPFRFLPEFMRKPLRFGIVHEGKYDDITPDEEVLDTISKVARLSVADIVNQTIIVSDGKDGSPRKDSYINGFDSISAILNEKRDSISDEGILSTISNIARRSLGNIMGHTPHTTLVNSGKDAGHRKQSYVNGVENPSFVFPSVDEKEESMESHVTRL